MLSRHPSLKAVPLVLSSFLLSSNSFSVPVLRAHNKTMHVTTKSLLTFFPFWFPTISINISSFCPLEPFPGIPVLTQCLVFHKPSRSPSMEVTCQPGIFPVNNGFPLAWPLYSFLRCFQFTAWLVNYWRREGTQSVHQTESILRTKCQAGSSV